MAFSKEHKWHEIHAFLRRTLVFEKIRNGFSDAPIYIYVMGEDKFENRPALSTIAYKLQLTLVGIFKH